MSSSFEKVLAVFVDTLYDHSLSGLTKNAQLLGAIERDVKAMAQV